MGRPVWEALGVLGVVRIERGLADVADTPLRQDSCRTDRMTALGAQD